MGVAQFGSVLDLGSRSREFESHHPYHIMYICMSGYVPECTIFFWCYGIKVIISDCLSEDWGSIPHSIAISIFVVFNAINVKLLIWGYNITVSVRALQA